jgi:hypothetical protein
VLGLRLDMVYAIFGIFVVSIPIRAAHTLIRIRSKKAVLF